MRQPFRTTSLCRLCDYVTVIVREDDESEEAFFVRRDEEATRLARHVRAQHPGAPSPIPIGREDRDVDEA